MNNEIIISKYIKDPPDLMIDVGVGPKSEYMVLSKLYPSMKIIGFEPHPVRFAGLISKFNGVLMPYAIWDKNEKIKMYSSKQNAPKNDAPSCFPFDNRDKEVTVEARQLDWVYDYIKEFKNILLWIDIEGAELKALEGATIILNNIKYINIEVCEDPLYSGACTASEIHNFLSQLGFKNVNNYQFAVAYNGIKFHDAIYIRKNNVET